MKKKKNNVLNYRTVSYQEIKKIANVNKKYNISKFDEWFTYDYKISDDEQKFLEKLITKNRLFLSSYNEAKLLFRFINPLLLKVDFSFDDIQDWTESWLRGELNGVKFSGKPDFMVAKGEMQPEKPYFFISELKQAEHTNNPEIQLLAELLVAMEINGKKIMHGCFIISEYWRFVILEKLGNYNYEYFVSESFDCLKIDNLKQIYKNLQAAKKMFCKD